MSDAQKDLDAAKRLCKEDESEGAHRTHAARLEAAYAAFAESSHSNPARPGVNPLTAEIVVESTAGS